MIGSSAPMDLWRRSAMALATALLALSGCARSADLSQDDDRLQVITTTGILRDLVTQVGGDQVRVTSLVPDGADPHAYEPSLRAIRNVVYADVAFSNYMLLEEQAIIKALDANLPAGVPNVSLAEGAVKYAAEIIPLVENVSLDTIWLGMRVRGDGAHLGADRNSDVLLSAVEVEGPGELTAYLTESFGDPSTYIASGDGLDAASGFRDDTAVLPVDAHTHMSWAFSEPGIYRLRVQSRLAASRDERPLDIASDTFTFAVGVDPWSVPDMDVQAVLGSGHADITVDLDSSQLYLFADPHGGGDASQTVHAASNTVIEVPNKAIIEVPGEPAFRFLGRPGESIFQLPQAVLGKHVHGEIDPHLWQDVGNAIAYVELIRDTLVDADPVNALTYQRNAAGYIDELGELDAYVRRQIEAIPRENRQLVTTHDAFGYLANAYGMDIGGFVAPNPATEPSLAARRKLAATIRNLQIPAVFLEPNLAARSSTLTAVAHEEGVQVCPIYGDTFDGEVDSYTSMMRFNADSLRRCLSPTTSNLEER
jgi:anchored repeat ABC transporter substrate-binding protein